MDCPKNTTHNIRHEKHAIKNKSDRNWKRTWRAMYCLGCKDNTQNFKPPEVSMTNKVLRKKLNGVVCRSSQSKFLKQKHNKNMQIYCKNLKNTQVTRSQRS